jgi:hypothetical protein
MDPDELWQLLRDALKEGVHRYVPNKMSRTKDSLPWLTTELRKLLKKQEKLYLKKKHTKKPEDIKSFKALKQYIQKKLRRAYWSYVEDLVTPVQGENTHTTSKKFWTYIKHCKKDNSGVAPLKNRDGHLEDNPQGKAQILNEQFCSVFSHRNPPLLKQLCRESLQSPFPDMPDITIGLEGVTKLLRDLKPHKAAGPDQVSPLVLKELHLELAPMLCEIFQKSLSTGVIPADWRMANVVPIFKKGSKHIAANYRPVSLTCISSKVMEHSISSQLMSHLDGNSILNDRQHGFRAKRSCETQLLEFTHELQQKADNGIQTDAIVLDFSKAFDKVSHNKLALKLNWYGVKGNTLRWISHFLDHRQQRVVVDGTQSATAPVQSGVPQGSVLGPILFLTYINDLPGSVHSDVRLFADDTIIYKHIKCKQDQIHLQDDLDRLVQWEREWDMEFHPGKCQVIQFTKSRPIPHTYNLHGMELDTVKDVKYLGVNLSSNLSWGNHITKVTNCAGRSLGFLKRNLQVSSPAIKEKAYLSLVRPQVEYCSTVWDPHQKYLTHRVEMVQRRAARWVLHRFHNTSSVTGMIQQLGWITLEQRRQNARLAMMYRLVHGLVAVNPHTYITPVLRQTRLSHQYSFIKIASRTDSFGQSFFPRTVGQWNALPPAVVGVTSLESFRSQLAGFAGPSFQL